MPGQVAIIGAGAIGAGWAARFLRAGWTARVFDPDPEAGERVRAVLSRMQAEGPLLLGEPGRMEIHDSLCATVRDADWVQESVPDRVALKRSVYAAVQAETAAPIASSSAELCPVDLQYCALRPAEILVARPSYPVEIMPLVEIEVGGAVAVDLVTRAIDVFRRVGMAPVYMRGTAVTTRAAVLSYS